MHVGSVFWWCVNGDCTKPAGVGWSVPGGSMWSVGTVRPRPRTICQTYTRSWPADWLGPKCRTSGHEVTIPSDLWSVIRRLCCQPLPILISYVTKLIRRRQFMLVLINHWCFMIHVYQCDLMSRSSGLFIHSWKQQSRIHNCCLMGLYLLRLTTTCTCMLLINYVVSAMKILVRYSNCIMAVLLMCCWMTHYISSVSLESYSLCCDDYYSSHY